MQKFFHPYNRKNWLVFILTLLIGIFIFPQLPEKIPVHFGAWGHADRYGSRWTIFLAPGINFAMIFLAESLRKIDPKSGSYKKFEPYYYNIHFIIALLMLGLMFIFLGNMMPKFKPNYFVGIKTSWTLASERVWYMTHRLAGKVWVVGGLFAVFLVFLPTQVIIWAFITILAILVLIPVFASLYFYQKYEE